MIRRCSVLILLLLLGDPCHSLILPPDPFESIDRVALFTGGSDRAIAVDQVYREASGLHWMGERRLWAFVQSWDVCHSPTPPSHGTLIFGPFTFFGERAIPKTEQVSFSVSDPKGPFLLRLANGTREGTHRVSSGTIQLNGESVFKPFELNQKVAEWSRQLTLSPGENLLEVRLRGAPKSFVTIELFQINKGACQVLDAYTFKRYKGKPYEQTLVFELGPQFFGPFTLHLTNGTADGEHRVDSAKIKLNGRLVFEPHDFSEKVPELSRVVSLQPINKISVELRGAPGDFLTLEVLGYDKTPPVVTISNPSSGAAFGTSPITVSGIVDDPSSSVRVNGVDVEVGSDGSFSAEGVVLTEGENVIKVIATDPCGNEGKDQVLVYLRSPSQGPSLILCAEPFREQTPAPPGEDCRPEAFGSSYGLVTGLTDESAISVMLNGILMPDGVEINDQGDIFWGRREGAFFWAFVNIPQVDGIHPFTVITSNSDGSQTEATVSFIRDTVAPQLVVTSPADGLITSNEEITITGAVDDPEAIVRLGGFGPELPVPNGSFTIPYTLLREGPNYLTVTARDRAGNSAFVSRTVILDTQPPQIDIASPAEGQVVNTSSLNVRGDVIDPNIGELTVSVNGGQPQPLGLTGPNFSGMVNLSPGQNVLVFGALDRAGNSGSATRSVLVDTEAPAVTIVRPITGAWVSGLVEIAVEAIDPGSGIAEVTLYVDNQSHASLKQPPYSFSVDTSGLSPGSHTLTVEAMDRAGNQAGATITVAVIEPMSIEITSPANGTLINQSNVIVQGRLHNQSGEVGVVVNGVVAEVQGSDFAVIIPLQAGENFITATATRPDGVQGQTQITINTESQEELVRLTVTPTSGVLDRTGVLHVTFEAEAYLPNPVSNYSWDFNGDGTPEITGVEPTVTAQYQYPGIYYPRVVVTDNQGNIYSETTLVHVLSREEMDALLRAKWEGMKEALADQDIDRALSYFAAEFRQLYSEIFAALYVQLPHIVQEMRDIQLIYSEDNTSKYRIRKNESYAGQMVTITYYIYFTVDRDGIWRIYKF